MRFSFKWLKDLDRLMQVIMILGIVLIVSTLGFLVYYLRDLPSPAKLRSAEGMAVSTQIYDRQGRQLYEIFAEENRTPVSLDSLPEHVVQATLAIEDKNFYSHIGFDISGMVRAGISTLFRQQLQGGSTLTQQLVKVSLLTRERTMERKIREAVLTLATEVMYSKNQILEMYLNHIPYGGTAWGIETAAQTFFGKSAAQLTLAEGAFLAGLPQSPTRYSPFGNTPELGKERQREVLRRMVEDGHISQDEADEAFESELEFIEKRFSIHAPHFVFYMRDQLVEEYGQAMVERGGLRVTTTLDLDLHNSVEASVAAEIDDLERMQVGNGAALVTNPKTGEILAMVGSRNYFNATHEGQINMTVRARQPGSSIKPLGLAAALQTRRMSMNSVVLDIPTCFELIGQSPYCPRNYDHSFRGPVTPRQALANSYNIPAIKVLGVNGLDNFIATASAMGVTTFEDRSRFGLSLALGAGEVPMTELATAFGTLANQGVKVPLISVLKIETYQGEVLYEAHPENRLSQVVEINQNAPTTPADERSMPELKVSTDRDDIYRVLDPEVAYLVSDIMSDNIARSATFGINSKLNVDGKKVAGKTGTTNDLRDNWTIGYTPEFLTIVWVGNSDNSPMNRRLVSGVTGAAPIWNDIMSFLLRDQDQISWPETPETIVSASFCQRSGDLPQSDIPEEQGCGMVSEIFWDGTQPQSRENVWRGTWIADETGLPPQSEEESENLRFEEHVLLTDPFTRDYCLTCERRAYPVINEHGEEVRDEEGHTLFEQVREQYFVTAERLYQLAEGFRFWVE